jgi:shikimate dehydrogenase
LDELSDIGSSGLTISTVPGSAGVRLDMDVRDGDVLFDIAYDVWPSINSQRWHASGGEAINGLAMLAAQALRQVRIFVGGSPETELPDERRVRSAMNAAVGLDESGLFALSVG